MNNIAIQTHKLTRDFDSLRAINCLDLKSEKGKVFGFLGPNGSGKTSTIRLLLGLLEPTAGHAEILSLDSRSQADQIRQRCGALLEHHGLYERLSAFDNLDFYARVWHIPPQKRNVRIQELLENLSLWERRSEIVSEWSWGLSMVCMLLGLITVNLVHGKGQLLMYSWEIGLGTIVLSLLVASLSSSLGILVSLRASTERQAQQTFSLVFMLLFIPMMLLPALPQEWQGRLLMWVVNTDFYAIFPMVLFILFILDILLIAAAMARFQKPN